MPTIPAKTIVSGYRKDGWFGSNFNMNIYKGCCHGCIYCDSRSDCYLVENFDTVRAKANALAVIENDLKSKRKTGIVMTGAMSDAYNPFEKELELTKGALRLVDKYRFGIAIDTKSDLVLRDSEILKAIQQHSPVAINFTITTADDTLCKKIEQHVSVSSNRFRAIKELSSQGIMCGVLLMPVLPFINDKEENILQIVRTAYQNGARWIYAGDAFGVTLRQNQRDYFYQKLDEQFPGLKQKYIHNYGNTYGCISPNNQRLWLVFKAECDKTGLLYRMSDIAENIKRNYSSKQMSLF